MAYHPLSRTQELWVMRVVLVLIAFGPLVVGVAMLGYRYLHVLPPTRIASCVVEYPRTRWEHVRIGVDGDDFMEDVHRCPRGTTVEKRRGEVMYRVDGVPFGTVFGATNRPLMLIFWGGIAAWIFIAMVRRGAMTTRA